MLDFTRTRIVESNEFPVQLGFTITAEGRGIVGDYTGGIFGVKEGTGAPAEKFIGVSMAQQMTPYSLPYYTLLTVPAATPYEIVLPFAPISGTLAVIRDDTDALLTVITTGNPASGEVKIVNSTLTFNAAQAGLAVRVQLRYVPTTLQWRTIQGDIPPGGAASLTLGTMGVIIKGLVSTTEFETDVDWNVANPTLGLAANGLFTIYQDGVNTPIPGAVITQLPAAGSVSDNNTVLVFELS